MQPLLAQYGFHVSLDVGSIKTFVRTYLNANFDDALVSVLSSIKLGGSVAFALIGNAILIPVAMVAAMALKESFGSSLDWTEAADGSRTIPPDADGPQRA